MNEQKYCTNCGDEYKSPTTMSQAYGVCMPCIQKIVRKDCNKYNTFTGVKI